MSNGSQSMPDDAVLLIPKPAEGDAPTFGIKPGYYNKSDLLRLVEQQKHQPEAIKFIADMLKTGNSEDDEFADLLDSNRFDPKALGEIVKICRE